jgi:hypothetical protein
MPLGERKIVACLAFGSHFQILPARLRLLILAGGHGAFVAAFREATACLDNIHVYALGLFQSQASPHGGPARPFLGRTFHCLRLES